MSHKWLHHEFVGAADGILMSLNIQSIHGLMLSEPLLGSVFLDINVLKFLNKMLTLVRRDKVVVNKVGSTHPNFKF